MDVYVCGSKTDWARFSEAGCHSNLPRDDDIPSVKGGWSDRAGIMKPDSLPPVSVCIDWYIVAWLGGTRIDDESCLLSSKTYDMMNPSQSELRVLHHHLMLLASVPLKSEKSRQRQNVEKVTTCRRPRNWSDFREDARAHYWRNNHPSL